MSLESKFDAAQKLLEEHNAAVGGEGKPGYVNPEQFLSCLKATGATTEERLKGLSYEDILDCLPTSDVTPINGPYVQKVKPRVIAKEIAKIFRGKEEVASAEKRPIHADRMTPRELVENFDPESPESPVGKNLSAVSKGHAFIVYSTGRLIDVETTYKLLMEIKQGYPAREHVDVNGEVKPIYKVGELPDAFADENPVYPGRPLRPDGTCDQTGRSWEGVSLEVRQLVRLAITTKSVKDVTVDVAHNLLDLALNSDAAAKLRGRYQKAALEFGRLEQTGDLPKLKIQLNMGKGGQGGNASPFTDGKKVVWTPSYNSQSYRAYTQEELLWRNAKAVDMRVNRKW